MRNSSEADTAGRLINVTIERRSELLLIRHGQAFCNVQRTVFGPNCSGLTENGRAAATAIAARLAGMGRFDALHASPTRRARQTAAIIGDRLGLPVVEETDLRVPDPGTAEGLRWSAIGDGAEYRGAEPWSAYLSRATRCLSRLADAVSGHRILVVGHSETIAAAFTLLTGVHDFGRLRFDADYTAMTTFRGTAGGRWVLFGHNDAAHMPDGLPRFCGHEL
jgi:probable phosphoglycerate mutase